MRGRLILEFTPRPQTNYYLFLNPLTAGHNYIRFTFQFKCQFLNVLKIKRDINQQHLKKVDLKFVTYE